MQEKSWALPWFSLRESAPSIRIRNALLGALLSVGVFGCASTGPEQGNGTAGGMANVPIGSCDARNVLCRRAPPVCPEGQVPSVAGRCWGECVRIEECSCTGPDACPNPEKYTCFLDRNHCGPYVR